MSNLYHFYEAIDDDVKDSVVLYVQCEWFNKTIDLDTENAENESYCLITVTDFDHYWQLSITRDMLIQKFPPSNCLIQNTRNKVLALSLRGSKWIKKHEIQWAYVKKDSGQLEMKLRVHYFDIIYGVAGTFIMEKMPTEKNKDMLISWFKHCAAASIKSNETQEALTERYDDMKKHNDDLKSTLDTLKTGSIEYRFTMFSNFAKILNTKKEKIAELVGQIDYYKKRAREDDDATEEERSEKVQKTTRKTAVIKNEGFSSVKTETLSLQGLIRKEASRETKQVQDSAPKIEPEPSSPAPVKAGQHTIEKAQNTIHTNPPNRDKGKGKEGEPPKLVPRKVVNLDFSDEESEDEDSEDELGDLMDIKTKKFDF